MRLIVWHAAVNTTLVACSAALNSTHADEGDSGLMLWRAARQTLEQRTCDGLILVQEPAVTRR
jgi:hypothetical protein